MSTCQVTKCINNVLNISSRRKASKSQIRKNIKQETNERQPIVSDGLLSEVALQHICLTRFFSSINVDTFIHPLLYPVDLSS